MGCVSVSVCWGAHVNPVLFDGAGETEDGMERVDGKTLTPPVPLFGGGVLKRCFGSVSELALVDFC